MKYPRLFEPIKVGKLGLSNRIAMPPVTTDLSENGFATDRIIDFYAERGRGGAGLIIVENAIVDSSHGRHTVGALLMDDKKYLLGLERLAGAVKAGGAKVALNLAHPGRVAGRAPDGHLLPGKGILPVAPSPIPARPGAITPKELTAAEIQEIEDKFAQAAKWAREIGYDMISLHGSALFLISQFLSPACNHRRDTYGGSLDNRMRFILEILAKVRHVVGKDFPILVRIDGEEHIENGLLIDEAKEIAIRLEQAGVDCISLATDGDTSLSRRHVPPGSPPMGFPEGCLTYMSEQVKKVVSVPVMTAGKIRSPSVAEDIIKSGRADIIGIGRGLLADAEWPKKARNGSEGQIDYCLCCGFCGFTLFQESKNGVRCSVNARLGQEAECRISRASQSKKVFVAGGGPAGLEAARVAALRGHEVHLFEKGKLGGQLNIASIPPGRGDIMLFLDNRLRQLKQLKVDIQYQELTADIVLEEIPDVVIAATGARPLSPSSLKGIGMPFVVNVWDVLEGSSKPGDTVVVLGGGQVGAETAHFLAQKGVKVTLVEMMDQIAGDIVKYDRDVLLLNLNDLKVSILTGTKATEITETGVVVETSGKTRLIKADTIVLALGARADNALGEKLLALGLPVHTVGDCNRPRKIANAVEDGFKAALKI